MMKTDTKIQTFLFPKKITGKVQLNKMKKSNRKFVSLLIQFYLYSKGNVSVIFKTRT